jgi:flagellar biosynthetic protein FlhB
VLLIGSIGAWLILLELPRIIGLGVRDTPRGSIGDVGNTFVHGADDGGALALIALIDVPAQIFSAPASSSMSKQEVKDEHKQTEGSPEVKGHIRRRSTRCCAARRAQAVAEATMVLTNPTHFAVALRYDQARMPRRWCWRAAAARRPRRSASWRGNSTCRC